MEFLTARLEYAPALGYQSLSPKVRGHFVLMGTRCSRLWVALFALAMTSQSFALHSYTTTKHPAPRKTSRRHRRSILWNPMFRPSHESLLLQNEEIDRLELPRIQDDDELAALIESQALLPIRTGTTLRTNLHNIISTGYHGISYGDVVHIVDLVKSLGVHKFALNTDPNP